MNNYDNALIFGKNNIERIVSVETKGDQLILFTENPDGSIAEIHGPASHWFITHDRISSKQTELEGNQYYKYLAEFETLEEKNEVKKKLYQKRVDFYNLHNTKEANLVMFGMTYFKGMKPNDISVLSFDIETDGLKATSKSQVFLITNTFRRSGLITRKTFSLADYKNQGEMLESWCNWIREMNPSVVLGHNVFVYDFFYLQHVARLNNVTLNLGRDNSSIRFNDYTSKKRKDGSQEYEYTECHIFGREIVDTFFLSLTFDIGRQFPSYGLKPIIKHLGFEKPGRSFIDASQISKYYNERFSNPEMWENTLRYAEEDSDDALKLYDLMIPAFFYLTQSISFPWQKMINSATGSQINSFMVRSYLQDGHSIAKATEITEKVKGGISFAVPGIYRNMIKIDLKSA
jgi:DNA polymerase elongation subunit (family B)